MNENKDKILNVGLIGCGLIGQKRAKALSKCKIGKLIACADINSNRVKILSNNTGAKIYDNWSKIVSSKEIDVVIVATTHDSLAEITKSAVKHKKHVLVEKPAARNASELNSVISIVKENSTKVHVGFNHRYHRSLIKAREIVDSGELGELMFVRARYGHGGRVGYENEWRANPKLSGGGELIDQGIHLIDLSRWFLGDIQNIEGFATNYFWDMPVEDNAYMLLKSKENKVAFLHASCTEWKNLFSFEIYGKWGKLDLSGLGGSYGLERITYYKMLPEMGPPDTASWEYPGNDNSWELEINDFFKNINSNQKSNSNLEDAYASLSIVENIYKISGYDHNS